jgi:hypothetical protein
MSPVALEKEDHTRDAEFNKAMHGKSAKARGGMTAMLQKDKAAQQAAVDEYFKHWDNKAAGDETEETRKVCIGGVLYTVFTNKLRNDETNTPPSQDTTTTSQPTCTSTAGDSLSTSPATPMASLSTRPLPATSTTLPTR